MRKDRERRVGAIDHEKELLDSGEIMKMAEEEEKYIDELVNQKDSDSFPDDESRELYAKNLRISYLAKFFKDKEEWRKSILGMKDATVMKMPRILQSIFYLLQYKREDVCQPGSNKFFWKFAKKHLNEQFLDKLALFTPLGVKPHEQQKYTTLNFIEKNIEGIVQEEVDAQCGMVMGKLFKWLQLCVKTRKDDILYRKAAGKRAVLVREQLI